jgi:uncharacterized protein
MSEALPELLDPRRAVATGAEFAGVLPLRKLPRLREMLLNPDGFASYQLRFGRDRQGRDVVWGHVVATLALCCQRCSEALSLDVDSDISLALTEGLDEAAKLPDDYEPLLLPGRLIRASELIEDELILAVPPIARHAEGQCRTPPAMSVEPDRTADQALTHGLPTERSKAEKLDETVDRKRPNPFAGLAVLKPDRSD